jgi:hypothetical protein
VDDSDGLASFMARAKAFGGLSSTRAISRSAFQDLNPRGFGLMQSFAELQADAALLAFRIAQLSPPPRCSACQPGNRTRQGRCSHAF